MIFQLTAKDLVVGAGSGAAATTVRRRRRERKLSLVAVARQAARAGIPVARYEFAPDGKIAIVTAGTNGSSGGGVFDDLDAELKRFEEQHG